MLKHQQKHCKPHKNSILSPTHTKPRKTQKINSKHPSTLNNKHLAIQSQIPIYQHHKPSAKQKKNSLVPHVYLLKNEGGGRLKTHISELRTSFSPMGFTSWRSREGWGASSWACPYGSGFRHGIHKATTPKASVFTQPSKGGGFVADGECLYPSRIATSSGCGRVWGVTVFRRFCRKKQYELMIQK